MRVTNPPLTETQKRFLRKSLGVKKLFSRDNPAPEVKKIRSFHAPTREAFAPKAWGRKTKGLSPEARLMIATRVAQKAKAREEFFAGIRNVLAD